MATEHYPLPPIVSVTITMRCGDFGLTQHCAVPLDHSMVKAVGIRGEYAAEEFLMASLKKAMAAPSPDLDEEGVGVFDFDTRNRVAEPGHIADALRYALTGPMAGLARLRGAGKLSAPRPLNDNSGCCDLGAMEPEPTGIYIDEDPR